jgi:hypothetical protein
MPRVTTSVIVAVLALMSARAQASEWGLITAGTTTTEEVRARYGAPTRSAQQKIEKYDATQWVYEGPQAPMGMQRMIVDFGLLTASGYKADVVRTFRLEPKPGVFSRKTIVDGWGLPSGVGKQGDVETFFYETGLLVYFDADGAQATALIFTPPQPPRR